MEHTSIGTISTIIQFIKIHYCTKFDFVETVIAQDISIYSKEGSSNPVSWRPSLK